MQLSVVRNAQTGAQLGGATAAESEEIEQQLQIVAGIDILTAEGFGAGLIVNNTQIIASVVGLPEIDAVNDAAERNGRAVRQIKIERIGRARFAAANGELKEHGNKSALPEFGKQIVDEQTGKPTQTAKEVRCSCR